MTTFLRLWVSFVWTRRGRLFVFILACPFLVFLHIGEPFILDSLRARHLAVLSPNRGYLNETSHSGVIKVQDMNVTLGPKSMDTGQHERHWPSDSKLPNFRYQEENMRGRSDGVSIDAKDGNLTLDSPNIASDFRGGNLTSQQLPAVGEEDTGDNLPPKPKPVKFRVQQCDNCFIRNYSYLHEPQNVCAQEWTPQYKKLDVVFLSLTKPSDFHVRDVIRNTWASQTLNNNSPKVRHVFLLGTTTQKEVQAGIDTEASLHGDIVQQNFLDAYNHLTLKTMLGLEWASRHCSNAKYAMKVDDDVYVNVRRIIKLVRAQKVQDKMIGNCILRQHTPRRHGDWKWRVPWKQYNQTRYPIYCNGPSYLLPVNVARAIVNVSSNIPFLKLEDVYVGICLRATGYGIRHRGDYTSKIRLQRNRNVNSVHCKNIYSIMTTHHTNPLTMEKVWKKCFEADHQHDISMKVSTSNNVNKTLTQDTET